METAYRPLSDERSLTETIFLKDNRKVARHNTVKYQWRVLQLLPGAERPSYAGLRVDVLERADGELMIRYQGEGRGRRLSGGAVALLSTAGRSQRLLPRPGAAGGHRWRGGQPSERGSTGRFGRS